MVRSLLKYSLSLLAILFFLFAGTGYNIVKHCCAGCAQQHMLISGGFPCEHDNHFKQDECCGTLPESTGSAIVHVQLLSYGKYDLPQAAPTCQQENHCSVLRVELDAFAFNHHVNAQSLLQDIAVNDISVIQHCLVYQLNASGIFSRPPPDLIPQSGRQVLAQKSVLII